MMRNVTNSKIGVMIDKLDSKVLVMIDKLPSSALGGMMRYFLYANILVMLHDANAKVGVMLHDADFAVKRNVVAPAIVADFSAGKEQKRTDNNCNKYFHFNDV